MDQMIFIKYIDGNKLYDFYISSLKMIIKILKFLDLNPHLSVGVITQSLCLSMVDYTGHYIMKMSSSQLFVENPRSTSTNIKKTQRTRSFKCSPDIWA